MRSQKIKLSSSASLIHEKLKAKIIERISQNAGVIAFSEFMQMALYESELGYYKNQLRKFGQQGDFITAPEMGDLFARSIANSITDCLNKQDLNNNIFELGAGSGALAADLLSELKMTNALPDKYYILESSASLQSLQKQTLESKVPELAERVIWLDRLPDNFHGIIIANEVADALPCEVIQMSGGRWQYLGVAYNGEQFIWQSTTEVAKVDLPKTLHQLNSYTDGYTTELRPLLNGWINGLANSLNTGSILLFDYGYPQAELYHPQRIEGSLRAFSRHQAHSQVFELVGLEDITSHVDFTQVAISAINAGLQVDGFTTQMGYLLENGILEMGSSAVEQNLEKHYLYSQQVQKLTSPGQMGEVVKVIKMNKNTAISPKGFQLQDHLCRL